jgi:predicted porin
MKKSLIALAALGVIGTASAQVTVFGVADVAVTSLSGGESITGLGNSGNSSSRLGFRSTTDLGNGLSAIVWLEGAVASDDTDKDAIKLARRSTVGLAGGFGEVRLGREHNASYNNSSAYDPFGDVGVGASHAVNFGGGSRTSNGVNYFLPKDIGGLFGQVTYAFGEGEPETVNEGKNDFVGARLGWAGAGLTTSVGFGTLGNGKVVAGGADKDDTESFSIGASYKIGEIVPAITYGTRETGDDKTTGTLVGVTVGLGSGKLKASFISYEVETATGSADGDKFAIGYVHSLDKSTSLYAVYASGDEGTVKASGLELAAGDAESGFQIGLTYAF